MSCRSPCFARAALRFPMVVSERDRAARDLRWATKPRGWEMEKAFRRRVRNAVCWLNVNRSRALGNMVASMPHRVAMCLERKGAMTEY